MSILIMGTPYEPRKIYSMDDMTSKEKKVRTFTLTVQVVADDDGVRKFLSNVNDGIEGVLQNEEAMDGIPEATVFNWVEQVERMPDPNQNKGLGTAI